MKIITIVMILLVGIGLIKLDWPKLNKGNARKEKLLYLVTLGCAIVASSLVTLKLWIPNPTLILLFILKPISKMILSLIY